MVFLNAELHHLPFDSVLDGIHRKIGISDERFIRIRVVGIPGNACGGAHPEGGVAGQRENGFSQPLLDLFHCVENLLFFLAAIEEDVEFVARHTGNHRVRRGVFSQDSCGAPDVLIAVIVPIGVVDVLEICLLYTSRCV